MGVAYGSSACLLACGPILGTFLLHRSDSLGSSLRAVVIFNLGRFVSYTFIGAAAATASATVRELLKEPTVVDRTLGLFMVLTSIFLIYRHHYRKREHKCSISYFGSNRYRLDELSLFFMGALISINLCAPLLSLSAISATSESIARGALYGALFALGNATVVIFFYGFVLSAIAKGLVSQFARYRSIIELFASLLLMCAGVMVMLGELKL